MAQLTLYLDSETKKRVEQAASREQVSVSRWVKDRLTRALNGDWPPGYFDLLGSLDEDDIERPPALSVTDDLGRERLP